MYLSVVRHNTFHPNNMANFFAWLFFFSLIAGAIYAFIEKLKYEKRIKQGLETISKLMNDLRVTSEKLQGLIKYEEIHDLDLETNRLEGVIKLKEIQLKDADHQINKAKEEAIQIIQSAKDKANMEAMRIRQAAELRAEETAGDAYRALRESTELKQMLKAIRNSIDGYGDEYLIPNHAALDELAEEYSHKEAGEDLKSARENVKKMVNLGLAAECDYTEANRKQIAIRFVLDAFNGKVDSVLAKVKRDNYGKLKQEMQDAYHLVNEHGKAFRNARIRVEYLEARQTELKWAVAVTELKEQELEEQRRIKQEMREEEKARREYEKAIEDAQKEERLLEKLMKDARDKLQAASEEERSVYEAKIKELEQKWKEAEARNQRALSMAQQTRSGHVYVISNIGSFGEDVFKIGLTRRLDPMDRVKELGDASVPFEFDVHAMIYNEDAPKLENILHQVFSDFYVNKVNLRKEFFKVGVKEIRETLEKMGIQAKWTMAAEALEYRESQAIERQMGDNKVIRDPDVAVAELLAASATERPAANMMYEECHSEPDDAETVESSAGDQMVECPLCLADISLKTLKHGSNQCPACNGEIELAATE